MHIPVSLRPLIYTFNVTCAFSTTTTTTTTINGGNYDALQLEAARRRVRCCGLQIRSS